MLKKTVQISIWHQKTFEVSNGCFAEAGAAKLCIANASYMISLKDGV